MEGHLGGVRKRVVKRVHVDNEGEMCETNEHDHVVNPGLLEAKIVVTQIRQRAANSRDPPRLLVQQAQATLSNEAMAEMPQYNSIQRHVQRKKKINGDPIANPRNIEEIAIPNSLRQTLRGDNFLLYDSGVEDADRFLIFRTQKNLDILAECSNWFADGTFKIAPHLFYQLHTLHALHEHSVLPMLYIFMQSKREQITREF